MRDRCGWSSGPALLAWDGAGEQPAFVLLGLILDGDEGEAELVRESGDRLVIAEDDEGDVGEGLGHHSPASLYLCKGAAQTRAEGCSAHRESTES